MKSLAAICLFFATFAAVKAAEIRQPGYHNRLFVRDCCLVIGHAGGAFRGRTYSNSREALDANFAIGRRIFEIDFSLTGDGVLALAHDWAHWNGVRPGDGEVEVPDAAAFLSRKLPGGLSPMTLPDLNAWLDRHPDALIVTDTKDDFSDFADAFFARPVDLERFIFQIYDVNDLKALRAHAETAKVILTIYKLGIDVDELIDDLRDAEVDALTMPLKRTAKDLPRLRAAFPDLPIYVHGRPQRINATELHFHLKDLGANGFYLD